MTHASQTETLSIAKHASQGRWCLSFSSVKVKFSNSGGIFLWQLIERGTRVSITWQPGCVPSACIHCLVKDEPSDCVCRTRYWSERKTADHLLIRICWGCRSSLRMTVQSVGTSSRGPKSDDECAVAIFQSVSQTKQAAEMCCFSLFCCTFMDR